MSIRVSAPSRLCLFGEHLDYLCLEVVTVAIGLRFYVTIHPRTDGQAIIRARKDKDSSRVDTIRLDLSQPLEYRYPRDYFRSCFRVLQKQGLNISRGYDLLLDSDIPIGKGMASSSAMMVALMKAILESMSVHFKDDPATVAQLAYEAEVVEFSEPGGKMDHIASAYGRVRCFDFYNLREPVVRELPHLPDGTFLLFDSLEQKDTLQVLTRAKQPVLEGLRWLQKQNIRDIREISGREEVLDILPSSLRIPLKAALDNHGILKTFLKESEEGIMAPERMGMLLSAHHANLRDKLGISTLRIESILDRAAESGAYGGKINGSGGGGCCFVFAPREKTEGILASVGALGFPGIRVDIAEGMKVEETK